MNFVRSAGGLALKSKKRGVLGWVMTTVDGQFTIDRPGKRTKTEREKFDTEEKAKAALMEAVQ